MIKVEFVINRLKEDKSILECVYTIKEILPETLPYKGDDFPIDNSSWDYPVVRFRTSYALNPRADGVLWTVTAQSQQEGLYSYLRNKGWLSNLHFG